jgi:hypothetical protein
VLIIAPPGRMRESLRVLSRAGDLPVHPGGRLAVHGQVVP